MYFTRLGGPGQVRSPGFGPPGLDAASDSGRLGGREGDDHGDDK